MEPMAPDWRAIGTPPDRPARPAARSASSPLTTRQAVWLGAAFVAALVLGAMVTLLVMPTSGSVLIDARGVEASSAVVTASQTGVGPDGPASALLASPARLVVDVEGAVARPGLLHAPAGARVGDALRLAGGFAPNADLAAAAIALNLAQEVTDGLKIVVPAIGDAPGGPASASSDGPDRGSDPGPVDLNRASESELDALPGVGPATIAKIVAARAESPFRSVDELRSRGIVGEATLGKLRDLVTVGR